MPLQCDVCNELALPTCPADESCFYGTDNGNSLRCYAAHSLQRHQKLQVVISPICPEVPSGRIRTKFGTGGSFADVIDYTNFFVYRFLGFDFVGTELFLPPEELKVAINIV